MHFVRFGIYRLLHFVILSRADEMGAKKVHKQRDQQSTTYFSRPRMIVNEHYLSIII